VPISSHTTTINLS